LQQCSSRLSFLLTYCFLCSHRKEIRLMDECSDEPYIQERLGKEDYMSLIDACVERR
ncbi:hypothetical protein T05_14831, partial [Trichinella murrelli]